LTSPLLDYKEKGHCVDFMVLRILIVLWFYGYKHLDCFLFWCLVF